jgi:hypothetical protein
MTNSSLTKISLAREDSFVLPFCGSSIVETHRRTSQATDVTSNPSGVSRFFVFAFSVFTVEGHFISNSSSLVLVTPTLITHGVAPAHRKRLLGAVLGDTIPMTRHITQGPCVLLGCRNAAVQFGSTLPACQGPTGF